MNMNFSLEFDQLSTFEVMFTIAIGMAIFWGVLLDAFKKYIFNYLKITNWWEPNALTPTKSMMAK